MRPDILIVGQGLAGTTLAWELERAGISFAIADPGHAEAATSVSAGIINPVTGRRLVGSWRYAEFFPLARERYLELSEVLGVRLWFDLRIRREFVDERERAVGDDPQRRVELARYIESADAEGWWLRDAARVDVVRMLAGARSRWSDRGWLRTDAVQIEAELGRYALIIDCRGAAGAAAAEFGFVPWEYSKGEVLELAVEGLQQNVVLNRRFWIVPTGTSTALVGATHVPGQRDREPTLTGRATLENAVCEILGDAVDFRVTDHRAGVRVNLPDKHPVAGRHPNESRLGLINGLGAKGALWAPMLARAWVEHLTRGAPFDPDCDVVRFAAEK